MIPYCILVIEDDNDREFMSNLYLDYHKLMYEKVRAYTKDFYASEDIVQNVLVKLIDKIAELRTKSRGDLLGYILTACRNASLNYIRDHGQIHDDIDIERLPESEELNQQHTAEVLLIQREDMKRLSDIWAKLDERSVQLLEGYYLMGKSMSMLADELNIKPDSVRMYLTRARRKAGKLLREKGGISGKGE